MLQRVVRSTVIDAPIDRVWALIRDFNSHDQWHGVVADSAIEGGSPSDRVGCVRAFTLKDGNRIREQLVALDEREHRSSYTIVDATVPLQRYVATVTLKPVTDGDRTFWHWESTFATPPGRERELREMVARDVYEAGFEDLRRHVGRGYDLQPRAASAMPVALAMQADRIVVGRYGDADVLGRETGDVPPPGAGEVRIRQRAIGVNYIDVYLRRGRMPQLLAPGGTPGMEAAGSVVDCGPGVHGFLPGDRVAYLGPRAGAYATLRSVPAAWCVPLPPAVDDDMAAALLLKGLTADVLLRDLGRVGRGTRLLVQAAAGGVGQLVCAWGRALGATVLGTVSSDEKARFAREHGCEHVIVARDGRFAAAVQAACGGADVLVDGIGAPARDENLAALAHCGHWISLGQAGGGAPAVDADLLLAKSLTFSRPVVFDYPGLRERADRLWAALADGSLGRPALERHALGAAAAAHERLESRRTTGALVLVA